MDFSQAIINLGYVFLVINTLAFIISYTEKDKALKYFIMYLTLCLFIQVFSDVIGDLKRNNLFLSHVYFNGQFILLSLFFSTLYGFKKFKKLHLFLTFLVVLFFVIFLINTPGSLLKWNVFEIATTSIPLIIYSFYFFVKNIDTNKNKKYIYFNSGFFLYTLCSTLIFTLGILDAVELKSYVWSFNAILYLAFQILIFVEWYQNFRKPLKEIFN